VSESQLLMLFRFVEAADSTEGLSMVSLLLLESETLFVGCTDVSDMFHQTKVTQFVGGVSRVSAENCNIQKNSQHVAIRNNSQ